MSDAKLKQELLYMVRIAEKYDLTDSNIVNIILKEDANGKIFSSVFGQRFKDRIKDLSEKKSCSGSCIICGRTESADTVICSFCMKSIGDSYFAKHQNEPNDEKKEQDISASSTNLKKPIISRIPISARLKKIIIVIAIVILSLGVLFQIGVLCLYMTIPDRNIPIEAKVSAFEARPVLDENEALNAIKQDFPESEGYTVTFCRRDREYAGAFSTELGEAALTDTSGLSDEELYNYYMTDTVYIFFISYLQDYTARLGIAEINDQGQILIQGSFNDGRDSSLQYRFR